MEKPTVETRIKDKGIEFTFLGYRKLTLPEIHSCMRDIYKTSKPKKGDKYRYTTHFGATD